MEENGVRINKFLSEAGVCSRREADRQIEAGKVGIDGVTAKTGDRVLKGQTVTYNGQVVSKEEEMILIALNKPAGIVCTAEKREKNNVIDYLNYPKRIYPIGRLDKDSEGLLLLTNNGEIVNKMMRSGNRHEKEYIVTVNKTISDSFIRGLAGGVPLVELGVTTRKCHVKKLSSKQFKIILTQGTLEGDIAPGDITFFRLQSTADTKLRAYVAQGERRMERLLPIISHCRSWLINSLIFKLI